MRFFRGLSLRARLAWLLAVPLLAGVVVFGWWVAEDLEPRLERQAVEELERTARLATALSADGPLTDSLATALGTLTGARVTLVAPDGRVLGDSEVPEERLPEVENHGDRPEVRAALEGRTGSARRASATVARSLLYVAVPHPQGSLRLAVPLGTLEDTVARTRALMALAALVALAMALLLGHWLAAVAEAPLRRVRRGVEELAGGGEGRRLPGDLPGEAGALAQAFNDLADRLSERVRELEEERRDLEALFDGLEDGLAVVDDRGIVRRANRTFRRWTGRRDLPGERFVTLFRDPRLAEALTRGLERGEASSREVGVGDRTVLASVQPYRGAALVILRDLTRLRHLEGVRRDFVANVSHELKTPLTSVVGFAEAIAEGRMPSEQAGEFAERILANAGRMRRLVDDLLDLALVESGSWTPDPEPVDVREAAHRVWRALDPLPTERGVELELPKAGSPLVHADPDALRQILRNLLDNALRFAPEGSAVRLRLREREGDRVRIEVIDTGPGIPSAHVERVFERFYRVDPARSREAGGTGLGLSIVKHLVAAHGGQVGLETEVGRGTTAWFILPASTPVPAEGTPEAERDARPRPAG